MVDNSPVLIADIGGTNARFALVQHGKILSQSTYEAVNFETLADAAEEFLSNHINGYARPTKGVFAIAGPVDDDQITMVNSHWNCSISGLKNDLKFDFLEVMNDFKAVALGILHVDSQYLKTVHQGVIIRERPIGIIGPGTGLGVASLIFTKDGYQAVDGEGGHVTMPVKTQREFDIFQELLKKYHHISAERVCSGKGLKNLYEAICTIDNIDCDEAIEPSTITKNALNGSCKASIESLDLMCAFLGRVAGNIALHLKARSGIYIAGGIPPKLGEYFFKSRFVEEFTAKGRMSDWISDIPVYMIDHPSVAMVGLQHHSTTL